MKQHEQIIREYLEATAYKIIFGHKRENEEIIQACTELFHALYGKIISRTPLYLERIEGYIQLARMRKNNIDVFRIESKMVQSNVPVMKYKYHDIYLN